MWASHTDAEQLRRALFDPITFLPRGSAQHDTLVQGHTVGSPSGRRINTLDCGNGGTVRRVMNGCSRASFDWLIEWPAAVMMIDGIFMVSPSFPCS